MAHGQRCRCRACWSCCRRRGDPSCISMLKSKSMRRLVCQLSRSCTRKVKGDRPGGTAQFPRPPPSLYVGQTFDPRSNFSEKFREDFFISPSSTGMTARRVARRAATTSCGSIASSGRRQQRSRQRTRRGPRQARCHFPKSIHYLSSRAIDSIAALASISDLLPWQSSPVV